MKKFLLLTLLLCLFATPCYANAGIPVFMFLPAIVNALPFGISYGAYMDYISILEDGFSWLDVLGISSGILVGTFLLCLVVSVEYKYLREKLSNIECKSLKKEVWLGNITTTLIGFVFFIPLPWAVNRLGFYICGPIIVLENTVPSFIHLILFLLYIPALIYLCFILSHRIEAFFVKRVKGDYSEKEVELAVKKANKHSYWTFIIALIVSSIITVSIMGVLQALFR